MAELNYSPNKIAFVARLAFAQNNLVKKLLEQSVQPEKEYTQMFNRSELKTHTV